MSMNTAAPVTVTTASKYGQFSPSMKALPRSPVAGTASTLTATMMAKAFQNNTHNKRGLSEMMAPPPTPTANPLSSSYQNNASYLDCGALQSSLKRVRLSSCPGELRLQRDLRHMVSSGSWISKKQENSNHGGHDLLVWHPPEPPVTAKSSTLKPQPRIELQQVETLRLRLTFEHSVVAWIQVPRMYPHRPPLISRIVYEPNYHLGDKNTHFNYLGGATTKQAIQSIVVQEALPVLQTGEEDEASNNSAFMDNANPQAEDCPISVPPSGLRKNPVSPIQCANTIVYQHWSPVQRLGDLLDFVISVFQQQHEEYCLTNNHSSSNNSYDSHENGGQSTVSLTYSSSSFSSTNSWSRRSSTSSIASSTANKNTNRPASFSGWSTEEQHQQDASMHRDPNPTNSLVSFLTPNRMHVGYDRTIPPMTMEVDAGQQQHSDFDSNVDMDL